jgi:hypothetical protein
MSRVFTTDYADGGTCPGQQKVSCGLMDQATAAPQKRFHHHQPRVPVTSCESRRHLTDERFYLL